MELINFPRLTSLAGGNLKGLAAVRLVSGMARGPALFPLRAADGPESTGSVSARALNAGEFVVGIGVASAAIRVVAPYISTHLSTRLRPPHGPAPLKD